MSTLKRFTLGYIIVPILTIVLLFEINPGASSYSYDLNILDCNNTKYMGGCRHEIGHKMDDDLGSPSLSPEFGQAVQLYIMVGLGNGKSPDKLAVMLLTHPGVYQYDRTHPVMVQREIYATIYAWANGNISKIPPSLRRFYSTDKSYKELYSCLTQYNHFNICGYKNFSYLKGASDG
jgi:hypothetical protein